MSGEVIPLRPNGPRLGGKWQMAPWIIGHLPPHELYAEPFGGSASLLLRKPRAPVEVLGDLDDELLDLYRVVRDPSCPGASVPDDVHAVQRRRVPPDDEAPSYRRGSRRAGPAHRREACDAVSPDVRQAETAGSGFRRYSGSPRRIAAMDWARYPDAIGDLTVRLQGVIIERSPAVDTIRRHDRGGGAILRRPPVCPRDEAGVRKGYAHAMTDQQHRELLDCLLGIKGMAVVSGYASPLYDDTLRDWRRVTRMVSDHARQRREEVLWISPRASRRPQRRRGSWACSTSLNGSLRSDRDDGLITVGLGGRVGSAGGRPLLRQICFIADQPLLPVIVEQTFRP